MRKSGIVAGIVGAVLLAGAILMNIGDEDNQKSREAAASGSESLVSTAHANSPATDDKPALEQDRARASNGIDATSDAPSSSISLAPALSPTPAASSGATDVEGAKSANVIQAPKVPEPLTKTVSVTRGDTLMELLVRGDVPRDQAHAVVTALKPVYDLRRMSIGQSFTLLLSPATASEPDAAAENASHDLKSLSFRPSVEQDIIVTREGTAGFKVRVIERPLERQDAHAEGRITSSLYNSAIAADLPIDVLIRLIQIFSFDVDFQREVQPGDGFEVLYDEFRDELGAPARTGEIVWASMTLSGKKLQYARFKSKSGFADYYDRRGQSVKKTLMRTPINGARLSSRFGKRRHPVLGYTKVHRGVDFAAPKGVPIMAAGDGVIESIGRNGSYGKYIRIRHNSTYKTAYAHMSGYGRGLKKGARVRQGSVIGYVGTTGRSTGPHLHYEVLKNGRQTNPMSVRLPAGDKLKGKALKAFLGGWPAIDKRITQAKGGRAVASD